MRRALALLAVAACVHAKPFRATPEQEATCAKARAAYVVALRGATCSNDWDCEPMPAYETAQCGAATSAQAIEAARPLAESVVAACHVIPELVERCRPLVGVCEKGQCGLRLARPSWGGCEDAQRELDDALRPVTDDACQSTTTAPSTTSVPRERCPGRRGMTPRARPTTTSRTRARLPDRPRVRSPRAAP